MSDHAGDASNSLLFSRLLFIFFKPFFCSISSKIRAFKFQVLTSMAKSINTTGGTTPPDIKIRRFCNFLLRIGKTGPFPPRPRNRTFEQLCRHTFPGIPPVWLRTAHARFLRSEQFPTGMLGALGDCSNLFFCFFCQTTRTGKHSRYSHGRA